MARTTGRVLLCRRVSDGLWGVPGGHVERGESKRCAAARELREETGFSVDAESLHRVRKRDDYVLFFVLVPDEFSPRLNDEHDRCGWFAPEAHPEPLHRGLDGVFEKPS
jgi:8-oxo-dGTP diphosphatase